MTDIRFSDREIELLSEVLQFADTPSNPEDAKLLEALQDLLDEHIASWRQS